MAIVFKIDNVDKSSLINFDSLEVQNNLYSKADACYFTYEKFGSRTYVPVGGEEIGVWDGATKIFGGKITNVKARIKGKVLIYDVECKDWVDQLDGELVSETYENKTVNQIVTDLQSKYATTFDISNVNCTTNIEAIYFSMKPMSKCLDELAEIAGYHWYVDPEKKIYFFSEGSITSPFDITDTNGKCLTQSLEIEEDYEQIKNRVNITGGSIANVQVNDAASIAAYGEHEVIIRDNSLTLTSEATQKANAVLASYKDPIKKGRFKTYDAGLVSGQKININSTLRGVNQDFIIQSVRFRARTPTDFNYEVKVMTQQGQDIIDLFEQEIMKLPPVTEDSFGNRDFTCDIKFTIVNYHKIEWEAGHIIMSSGETYNISAGNREFTNTEIIYFKPSVSTTELQHSETFGDGVGEDVIGLGYAVPNPNTSKGAQFLPKGFMGGVRFWGGENIVARTIIADQIGLQSLTSDLVTTGEFITLSAQIKNAIITDAKITDLSVEKLISGTITSKTIVLAITPGGGDSFIAAGKTDFGQDSTVGFILGIDDSDSDKVKFELTGGKIQTSGSGQRAVLSSSDNTLRFYNSTGQVIGMGTEVANAIDIDLNITTTNGIRIDSAVSGEGFRYFNSGDLNNTALSINMPSSFSSALDNNWPAIDVKYGGKDYILMGEALGDYAGGIYLLRDIGTSTKDLIRLYDDTITDYGRMIRVEKAYTGNLSGPIVSFTNLSYGEVLRVESDNVNADHPTLKIINGAFGSSSPALLIDKNNSGYAMEIDQNANNGLNTVGMYISIVNDGGGSEYAFAFQGSEYDGTKTSVSGLTGVIKILTSDGACFIPVYNTAT